MHHVTARFQHDAHRPPQLRLPPVDPAETLDFELPGGASFAVRFGDVLAPAPDAAVVVPAYAGGAVLAAVVGRWPGLCDAFSLGADAPEAVAAPVPDGGGIAYAVFTRYARRLGAAYVTGHWSSMARALEAAGAPPRVSTLRTPAFGLLNGVSHSDVARCILYGATGFLQDEALRGPVRRVELVLAPGGERVFAHIRNFVAACGLPPVRHPCVVCSTFPRSVVLRPCGHWAVCAGCLREHRRVAGLICPVCREPTDPEAPDLLAVRPCPPGDFCCPEAKAGTAYRSDRVVWAPCGHAGVRCAGCDEKGRHDDHCPACKEPATRVASLFSVE